MNNNMFQHVMKAVFVSGKICSQAGDFCCEVKFS